MLRHPLLQPLSREHHHALVLARHAIRWATEGDESQASGWQTIRETYRSTLESHFRVEEDDLLPRLGPGHPLADRTLSDHVRLRELAEHGSTAAQLLEFGELLRSHVRFEERQLFPALEELHLADRDPL